MRQRSASHPPHQGAPGRWRTRRRPCARSCPSPHQRPQPVGHHAQELVADGVAERVVDVLEMVEVENVGDHQLAALDARPAPARSRSFSSTRLGRPGERVVQRQVACPVGQVQDVADVLAERAPVEGLEQERGGARRQRALERAAALVAGQDDDGNVLERRVAAHAPDEVEAVEVRHLQIDDGEVEHRRSAGAPAPRGRPPPRPRRRTWQPFSRRRPAKRRRRPQPGPMAFALLPRALLAVGRTSPARSSGATVAASSK